MISSGNREVWGRFWEGRSPTTQKVSVPDKFAPIDAVQRRVWSEFATSLPRHARVLDLGTGSGVVLARMAAVRADLKLVGVDSAPSLPPAAKGISLKPGVGIEDLPFADGSFNAATSQFGLEYGDTAAASLELFRVLEAGSPVQFIVHHRGGSILAHNAPRRIALHWALVDSGLLAKARALVRARTAAAIPTPLAFRQAPQEAQRQFPTEPVAAEFLAAILQTLELSSGRPAREALEVLDALGKKATNELERIDSLEGAACDAAQLGTLLGRLSAAGFEMKQPVELLEQGSERPFAWLVAGQSRGS